MIRLLVRAEPLAVAGVHARGEAARALARILLARPEQARRLSGVAVGDGLVLLGAADDLPWADEVTWLGREPEAPALLVPTLAAVSPHATLVLAALRARHGELAEPVALVRDEAGSLVAIPLGRARMPGGAPLVALASRGSASS